MIPLGEFLKDDRAQDLLEYTLLLAFVCLGGAAVFISSGGAIEGIWNVTNSKLGQASNTAAS
jgi:Flp pilus assembly pilin Flp